MTFHVLSVCTGNVCRSPFAAQLLAARLAEAGIDAEVTSAGTHALVDSPMTPEAAAMSRRAGVDPDAHAGRQLTADLVQASDLILVAAREHRARVLQLVPRASRRTFTLREFARIADFVARARTVDPSFTFASDDPAARVEEIALSRGLAEPPATPQDDDVVDPYRRSPEVYAEAERLITVAVDGVARALAATASGGRGAA
ncbi:Low molecular weight protein-tyrosine-phosphatase Etp [Agromyces sp. NDB4Y10]|uniref:arsenate reductase/protein-tyrosine-phosphatase family protein n=1 Tax=Agromyces sp. NDB4Y10 TaxID=1775951 RepID=UPI0007B22D18|nr:low molecular weight phosphatase family protein [Agromyces sp. NDB4Y10]KZE92852.1 Low molecular weight protein-tyrosine-phosphatase Etp [Agromyces sp. NDB4Y10]